MIETPRDVETDAQVVLAALHGPGTDAFTTTPALAALDRILAELQQTQDALGIAVRMAAERLVELQQVKDELARKDAAVRKWRADNKVSANDVRGDYLARAALEGTDQP